MNETEFSHPIKIDHIDKSGQTYEINADEQSCLALARRFDIEAIQSISATIKIHPQNARTIFHVTGTVTATVTQQSIVSQDTITRNISQDIEAWFTPQTNVTQFETAKYKKDGDVSKNESNEIEREMVDEKDEPELILNGAIDIGELASQFLGLALDDYPRLDDETEGSGDYIEVKPEDAKDNPFAALAQLKKDKD